MGMASGQPGQPSPYDPSYRQADIDETLEDHETRISDNERTLLILKGVAGGLAMATAADQGVAYVLKFLPTVL